jgi:cell wall-associated NlpC family hydrolase
MVYYGIKGSWHDRQAKLNLKYIPFLRHNQCFVKLPLYTVLLFLGLLTSCNSFRPITSNTRNPSRAPQAQRTAEHVPRKNRPAKTTTATPPATAPLSTVRKNLVSEAEGLLGVRYKYGGNTPREGFDCSGLVKYIYNDQGLDIHRVSREQARQGTPVKANQAQAGDLVFYRRGANQPVFHVSLVVDARPGQIWVIHSTTSRGVIREDILASSYWRPKIYTIKRMIN